MRSSPAATVLEGPVRFVACGSVDDGKSTLIGRLLADTDNVCADQFPDAKSRDGSIDYSLLLDGLKAEREQRITIDVAYRYFTIGNRRFIVADCPGHEQYTRNMATGASTADFAVVVVDATRGVTRQTIRHCSVLALMGVRSILLAINKVDLIEYDELVVARVATQFAKIATELSLRVDAIPVVATSGENVTNKSARMPWYTGPTLLKAIESFQRTISQSDGFRFPVQSALRPFSDFRGYAGTVALGSVSVGNSVVIEPTGTSGVIKSIETFNGPVQFANKGDAITLVLDSEVDCSRGDVICAGTPARTFNHLSADLVWFGESHASPADAARTYLLKVGTKVISATVVAFEKQLDFDSGKWVQIAHGDIKVEANQVVFAHLALDRSIAADPFDFCRETGSLILIDRVTKQTVAVGMVRQGRQQSANTKTGQSSISQIDRRNANGHDGIVVWLTGIPSAGKSTIAFRLERLLFERNISCVLLDGDNLRQGLSGDLTFTPSDRRENIRRTAEVAKLIADSGIVAVCALVSPLRTDRALAKEIIGEDRFKEVFVDLTAEIAASRDQKGNYRRAMNGALPDFTGVTSPYEPPTAATVRLDTSIKTADDCAFELLRVLDDLDR